MDVAALHAGEHIALRVADADIGGVAGVFLFSDVEIAVLTARDVVGAAHAGPLAEEVAVGGEDLDALVRPVGDVELAIIVERDAVRQMELAHAISRLAPRVEEAAVAREAMHAGVAVAVGYIKITVRMPDHLGGVIERPRGTLRQPI